MKNLKSKKLFEKVSKIIPLWTQTFSKSYLLYYRWDIPRFIEKGKWCFVWDVDGNKYIDYVNWLSATILWNNLKEVNDAIKKQLEKGIIFSLASPLEYELSKKLIEIIPCAEMVRFGKSWTDATSSAIRLARYVTKREKIAVCGYHGRQDRYIGSTTRNGGVPKCVQDLTLKFEYNNIKSLENIFKKNPKQIAAIIMEPMNTDFPKNNFLQKIKTLCHKNGSLFILDETVTWFKLGLWWAQKYFGVMPDLAAFGKSMANGMPIAALVGKKEYMQKVEEIFFSWTYLWETISMAAALATINFMQRHKVREKIYRAWGLLKKGINNSLKKHGLDKCISLVGFNNHQFFVFKDYLQATWIQIKSYLQKELLSHWILWIGGLNMSYAHTDQIIKKTISIFDICLSVVKRKLSNGLLVKEIKGKEIDDIFKIR